MSFTAIMSALGISGASVSSALGSIGNVAQSVLGTSALNSAGTGLAVNGSQGGLLGGLQSMTGGGGGGTGGASGGGGGSGGGGMSDPAMGVLKMIFGGPPPAQAIPDTASTLAGLKQQTDAGKQLNVPNSTANSGGFMSGLLDPLMTNGEYDSTKAGGMVGSMLGQSLKSGGGMPQAPEINFGDISIPETNQSFSDRPWTDDDISSYLSQLLGG